MHIAVYAKPYALLLYIYIAHEARLQHRALVHSTWC